LHRIAESLNVVLAMSAHATNKDVTNKHAAAIGQLRAWQVAGVWMIPALLSTAETVIFAAQSGHPIAAWRAFVGEAPQWFGWAALMPIIVALGERYPLRRSLRSKALLIHATASLGASVLLAVCDALVNAWVRPSRTTLLVTTRNWFLGDLPATTLVYFAILIASYAWHNSVRLRERDREAAALEAQLREAQLAALRMQLQPHFLFNSLNAVMALVRDRETDRAVRALSLLSDVLRATVNAGDAHETTLAAEIEFVTRYLGIEQVRFGDRLRVVVDVPEQLMSARVPVFILQPFVENSLKHGVLRDRGGNEIRISADGDASALVLRVQDDGRGFPLGGASASGVGISNARRRLERMYGVAAALTVADRSDSPGVEVMITLPFAGPPRSTPVAAVPVELAV
jgi:two-component sensor histidine kinase